MIRLHLGWRFVASIWCGWMYKWSDEYTSKLRLKTNIERNPRLLNIYTAL